VDPKAGDKEKNSACAGNLTPVIKPVATQKATYSSSHGSRDNEVTVMTHYGLDGLMFEKSLRSKQPSVQVVPVLFSGGGK
jgi:hypothetical protein